MESHLCKYTLKVLVIYFPRIQFYTVYQLSGLGFCCIYFSLFRKMDTVNQFIKSFCVENPW